jgi:hypothetical protein
MAVVVASRLQPCRVDKPDSKVSHRRIGVFDAGSPSQRVGQFCDRELNRLDVALVAE